MGRGYGILCPTCSNPLELEDSEVHVTDVNINIPIKTFQCTKCDSHFRWKSKNCPQCGDVMVDAKRPMDEPLFWEHGLYCLKCKLFWNDSKNLEKLNIEEVEESAKCRGQ